MKEISTNAILAALTFLVLGVMAFNIYLQGEISKDIAQQEVRIQYIESKPVASQPAQQENTVVSFAEFLPKGVPRVYGQELGVSFDEPVDSLAVLSNLDGDLYPNGIMRFADLTAEERQDYIKIGSSISCEFCCGVDYITAPNGQPACGCAHSAAMRGLAKYLVKNHRSEFTNQEILEELNQWKTMFFPKQMYQRAVLEGNESGIPSVLDEVPDMVGGC